jgi:hypothetical protein
LKDKKKVGNAYILEDIEVGGFSDEVKSSDGESTLLGPICIMPSMCGDQGSILSLPHHKSLHFLTVYTLFLNDMRSRNLLSLN